MIKVCLHSQLTKALLDSQGGYEGDLRSPWLSTGSVSRSFTEGGPNAGGCLGEVIEIAQPYRRQRPMLCGINSRLT